MVNVSVETTFDICSSKLKNDDSCRSQDLFYSVNLLHGFTVARLALAMRSYVPACVNRRRITYRTQYRLCLIGNIALSYSLHTSEWCGNYLRLFVESRFKIVTSLTEVEVEPHMRSRPTCWIPEVYRTVDVTLSVELKFETVDTEQWADITLTSTVRLCY